MGELTLHWLIEPLMIPGARTNEWQRVSLWRPQTAMGRADQGLHQLIPKASVYELHCLLGIFSQ